jgi:hypothetical protein
LPAQTKPPAWPGRRVGVGVAVALVLLGGVAVGLLRGRDAAPDPRGAAAAGPVRAAGSAAARRSRTFIAVADAMVDAANPNRDHGSSRTLRVDARPVIRSYLRFKIRGLTGTVRSATLRMWANSRQRPGYQVRGLGAAAWSEATITFARQPPGAAQAPPLDASGPVAAGSWTSVDVTPLLDGGPGARSLMLETSGPTGLNLASREDAAHAPRLVVQTE